MWSYALPFTNEWKHKCNDKLVFILMQKLQIELCNNEKTKQRK